MSLAETAPPTSGQLLHPDGRVTRKGMALVVVAISQLMVVLDATIVNVALPDMAKDLHVTSNADLQWVVTAYTLTFGGFLLLGGKLADRVGRRAVFMGGAALFAFASLLGGMAGNLELLIAARALQGIGGGVLLPPGAAPVPGGFPPGGGRGPGPGVL